MDLKLVFFGPKRAFENNPKNTSVKSSSYLHTFTYYCRLHLSPPVLCDVQSANAWLTFIGYH